jgi:hypothetical protein
MIKLIIDIKIIIFTYNRSSHLQRLVDSLRDNNEFNQLEVCFAIDAPKTPFKENEQKKIFIIINELKKEHKKIEVILQKKNLGSKKHIKTIVDKNFIDYEKLIIIEDDLEVDKFFLNFMCTSLEKYKKYNQVFHISGFNFIHNSNMSSAFLSRYMNCWGWATWRDRWEQLTMDADYFHRTFSNKAKWEFNCNGSHDFFRQITENRVGILNTWAIFWYASIFEKGGLCLYPPHSLVKNNGRDNSGERNGKKLKEITFLNTEVKNYPYKIKESNHDYLKLVQYFKSNDNHITRMIKYIVYLFPYKFQKRIINKLIYIKFIMMNIR